MIELEDGSFIAQLGVTDMRLPIQYALTYPERLDVGLAPMDLSAPMTLELEPPDFERFQCLKLAYDALAIGGSAPAVLNAANEIAVAAFLDEHIGFLKIPDVIEETLSRHQPTDAGDVESVLEADRWARAEAQSLLQTPVMTS